MKIFKNLAEAAREILAQIFKENRYADKALEYAFKQHPQWGARDRRFVAETVYGIVRWKRLLQEVSGGYASDSSNEFWKVFGAWCVLNHLEIPRWDELSNVNRENILSRLEQFKALRTIRESIPDWLDELGCRELGEETWEKEIYALNQEAKVVLRVNTLKTSREELQKKLLDTGVETYFFPDDTLRNSKDGAALILKKRQNIFSLPEFKQGFFEMQDASSQRVAPFLNASSGMRVIDACAGGGGKTLHLAALMQNKGKIIAMDTEPWKLEELKRRARRAGASNLETRIMDSNKVIKRLQNTADRLLLDVPCSGLGVLKRNPDAKWKLSPEIIERVQKQQLEILQNYSSMLKPGGILVYATCSILSSENEKQVEKFLLQNKGRFEFCEEKKIMPSDGFDGFYMAALRRVARD